MQSRLIDATNLLRTAHHCCVVIKGNEQFVSDDFGIKPLMTFLRQDRQFFKGGVVADKIIGKAAALLLLLGGAQAVHGELMSDSAANLLEAAGVPFTFGSRVPCIENRTRTGLCPMEETVVLINNPEEAFEALEKTIARLMSSKS